jgi:hypothetical protein
VAIIKLTTINRSLEATVSFLVTIYIVSKMAINTAKNNLASDQVIMFLAINPKM